MKTEQPRVYSNMPLPPGRILRREIEHRGISRNELADRMDCSVELVNGVINADAPVTPEIARAIEDALEIPAYLWTRLEASYRATLAHNRLIEQEGRIHDRELSDDCPERLTYQEDDDDEFAYTYDEQPSSARILRDEGE